MHWDKLAEKKSHSLYAAWLKYFSNNPQPCLSSLPPSFIVVFEQPELQISQLAHGFNALVRFPILGRSRFRCEKTSDETSVMAFIARFTSIPVPTVLGAGKWSGGPYIITTVIEGTLLSKRLRDPSVLAPSLDVSESDLKIAYSGMAHIVLELSKPVFKYIGGLKYDSGGWSVAKRPLTLKMNELIRVGNFPPDEFVDSNHTFESASKYFQQLAEQQFLHLKYQRNDAITDEDDCRKKYVARCLFRQIAQRVPVQHGRYHLFCDDLRPSNVLVTESDLRVNGVIDWEYTYVAPAEFTYSAPWWLLFESPEAWDLDNFMDRYRPRLELFLKELRVHEDEQIRQGSLKESQRLSERMALSIKDGLFWFCLAARNSFMFDEIYWTFLDEQYFGPLSSLDDRLSHLTQDERDQMEDFVQAKMQQIEERRLDEHQTFDQVLKL
ncbi:hypothetical protein AJ78_08752 [Emergomyces pasteurianus Ep9510]|uniref:Aminoglycoside phosphotransferase domain-containing protein n=1 Tax=Emergomyces pasteurianus Ep9510 TaxID=1447872 RepID=A0A1J9P2N1_9EURO|nr:hypothetical protein AJ78_08752 [Emergomyces pasteurianus Ep9510]